MKAHIVIAHPEPLSYNAHLAEVAKDSLVGKGYSVTVSDLYAMDFDPCERADHYLNRSSLERFDVQLEQRHASDTDSIPDIVKDEIKRLDEADILILQYPMWWHLPPAMLKGWLDRVLVYGDVYTGKKRFEHGRYAGKKVMLSVTVGTSQETYAFNGRSGDIELLLWPVNFSLAYVGYEVLEPFVAYGVEAGLKYSSKIDVERRLSAIAKELSRSVSEFADRKTVRFNKMAEWGPEGTIVPDAPSYSPFMRHRQKLDLG